MFFSKLVLLAISLVALSVLATPHALHHHALHRRVVAARVASANSNPSNITARRRSSPKCAQHSAQHSAQSSPPAAQSAPPSTSPVAIVHHTPAPAPVTTPTFSPTPTPQQHPTTTSTATPPETTPGSSGPSSGLFTGQGTFYATGLGACGLTNQDTDFIAAVSKLLFDTFPGYNGINPNSNPICGKKARVTAFGRTIVVTITDRCTGCAKHDLDFSPSAFNAMANPALGRIPIEWGFV